MLSLLEAVGAEVLAEDSGWAEEDIANYAQKLSKRPELLPPKRSARPDWTPLWRARQPGWGVGRHVGRLSELYTPSGLIWVQDGKDLSEVDRVIGTGGVLVNSQEPRTILAGAEKKQTRPLWSCGPNTRVTFWMGST